MEAYEFDENYVRYLIEECKMSMKATLRLLESQDGCLRGLSLSSLEKFCRSKRISKRCRLNEEEVDQVVGQCVNDVGPSYGYRMVQGHIVGNSGLHISEKKIKMALKTVDPEGVAARTSGIKRRMNPCRYFAPYFGYNLHVDQNEKLVDFGVVFVAAIDGYLSYVFEIAVMPRKNNIAIYRNLFEPLVRQFGLFRRVHADFGQEFILTLFMQQQYWTWLEPEVDPESTYRQTKSTKNNRIERFWEENNARVTYPMKCALVQLESFGLIDRDNQYHVFSTSHVCMYVGKYGADLAVKAWNNHYIRGRGILMNLMGNCGSIALQEDYICSDNQALWLYRETTGRALTFESPAGVDRLDGYHELKLLDSVEVKELAFWINAGKKKEFFYVMPSPPPASLFDDDDDDYVQPGTKRKSSADSAGLAVAKRMAQLVNRKIDDLRENLINDQNVKELIKNVYSRYKCYICQDVISGKGAVCLKCNVLVGCEKCHVELTEKVLYLETPDDDDEQYERVVTKERGTWVCPLCTHTVSHYYKKRSMLRNFTLQRHFGHVEKGG